MEIRSTWHSFVQMQMLASDVNEATIASYSHVNLSTFSVARPESLLWSWRNNRRKSGESWTINHNQSFISQSVKEDDQLKKERMNVLLEESCQKLDLNSLTFSCWSNFLLPYLLDLVSNISILRKNPFYRAQVYLGSDLWVWMFLSHYMHTRGVCKLFADSVWWRYQLNTNWYCP